MITDFFKKKKSVQIPETLPHYTGEKIRIAYRPVHYSDEDKFFWCPTMTKDECRGIVHEYRVAAGLNPFADFVRGEYDLQNTDDFKTIMDRLANLPNEMRGAQLFDEEIAKIKPTGYIIWVNAEYDD